MSTDLVRTPVLAGGHHQKPFADKALNGRVRHICHFTKDVIAIEGVLRPEPVSGWDGEAVDPMTVLAARAMSYRAGSSREPDDPGNGWLAFLGVLRLVGGAQAARVDLGHFQVLLDPSEVRSVSAEELGWMGLSGSDSVDRDRVINFVANTVLGLAGESTALARELHRFRDAAREGVPHCEIRPDLGEGLYVDSIHRVGSLGFYLRGWIRTAGGAPARLTAVSPEGTRTELFGNIVRFPRPDVDEFYGDDPVDPATAPKGFLAYFETPTPSILADGWIVEMAGDGDGQAVEFRSPPVLTDHPTLRTMVLNDIQNIARYEPAFVVDHAFPCLSALQDRALRTGAVASLTDHGQPPLEPEVSVIVPLYGRIDFLEHQLAQFVSDPDLATTELIYVLDSPELRDDLAALAGPLHQLYGVPFRVVTLSSNMGYAGANTAGASVAGGKKILLMNSDVIPEAPGWISRLAAFLDDHPRAGAVGPKLLYEDGSIQHAGMYFHRDGSAATWENLHFFKGLHRSFPAANEPRVVPALTGACMLMGRELWDRVGGFKGMYVQGDFEDSDLCLRLIDLGFECWYLPEVELYHLEGQSYPDSLRRLSTRFNAWLHTHLWDDRITEIMSRFASGVSADNPHRKDER